MVIAFLLRTERPLRLGLCFLAGAATCELAIGAILVVLGRVFGLDQPENDTSRGSIDLLIGVVLIVLGIIVLRRKPATSEPSWRKKLDNPRQWTVFVLGIALYLPSAAFIAATQQIATTPASWQVTVLALVLVVAVVLLLVELPLASYRLAPAWTDGHIGPAVTWLERHSQQVLAGVLIVLGALTVVDAITALT